jgi:hypothetical protein
MALGHWQNPASNQGGMPLLKKLFWTYFLLLIFEGALRKWVLPQYAAPLLLVRDPVGLLIILEAYRTNKWPQRWSLITGVLAAGFVGLCVLQAAVGDNPWIAAVYGLRSYLLPFPVAFIMGENLDAEDLRKFAVCAMWLMLPETALAIAQYVAPSGSVLNAGAYAGGTQIGYVGGHVRASGTFSFVVGLALFCPMVAAFVLYGLARERFAKTWLLWAAAFAVIVSVPVVGSRTLLFELAAIVACAGVSAALGVSQFLKSLKILVPVFVVFVLASFLPVFSESSKNLGERVRDANQVEGRGSTGRTIAHRTVVPVTTRIADTDFTKNPIGIGMGRGSAAISKLLLNRTEFTAGENEIDRAIIELGPFPGLAFTLFRFGLAFTILGRAFLRARAGQPLALLFAPLMFSGVFLGVLEQPTDQGFMVIALAFSLAALKPASVVARANPSFSNLPRPRRYSSLGR